jgi:hypothetical protein
MGTSTITLKQVLDTLVAKGIPNPRENASGYGDRMAIDLATQVMADIACERFNWKWNRADAAPFLTNSWQQDYPQPAQPNGIIGWGEDCDAIDILNTRLPKPLRNLSWRRGLSRTSSLNGWWPGNICWMYNEDLFIGQWPGPNVLYSPLTVSPQPQNPLMSMTDANGNILIVTTPGTTNSMDTPPVLPAGSAEGTTVGDGSVVWTCVSPTSQGFRLDRLPPAQGPTLLIKPYYQLDPVIFKGYGDLLSPMPDSFSRFFYRGLESELLIASNNAADLKRGQAAKLEWMNAMREAMKQGDRELNAYSLLPARPVVDSQWQGWRPYTADDPY